MSDEKTLENMVAGKKMEADQWYAIRATAFARRTSAGRLETKAMQVNMVKVDSPDEPMPPEGEVPPEGGEGEDRPVVTPQK
jgi:hypothetical protein